MEVEGNLEEDEEDRHQFAGSGERSAEAVASVGEDGAGEVNSVLETPALTLRLLHTSHLTTTSLVLTPGKVKSVGSDETTFLISLQTKISCICLFSLKIGRADKLL